MTTDSKLTVIPSGAEMPFSQQQSVPVRLSLLAVVLLVVALGLLLLLAAWLGGHGLSSIAHDALGEGQAAALVATMANGAEVMAAVLAIAVTVVAIVVELAANRYSHRVTALFLRSKTNVLVLSLFAVTTLYCIWLALVPVDVGVSALVPQAGWLLGLALVTLCIALLLPYFAYVLAFIAPLNIIGHLRRDAEMQLQQASASVSSVAGQRSAVALVLEDLQEVARKAVEQHDRGVAMASANALFSLLTRYRQMPVKPPPAWYRLDSDLLHDPDFVSLEEDSLATVRAHNLWFEWKVSRQLALLVGLACNNLRDLASLVATNLRLVATAGNGQDEKFLGLMLKTFNSCLRTSINANDARTSYYLLSQYRVLAEDLLGSTMESFSVDIAQHLRYYGHLAVEKHQPFLLEVAAYDLVHLVDASRAQETDALSGSRAVTEQDHEPKLALTDALLDVLLTLDIAVDESTAADATPRLLGVRRAQLQLAARLLAQNDSVVENRRAVKIAQDLAAESMERLQSLCDAIKAERQPEFHELTERGVNFGYLAPEYHEQLQPVLALVAQQRSATQE